jgi:tetratricopeptide (TPR) repeat protein
MWRTNLAVRSPTLDGYYFLNWAHDVANGDVLGRGGIVHGEPFLFNPLYAYVIAPLVGAFGISTAPMIVFQTLLAAATAALAAAAARRFAGTAAAWTAGLAVAFSTPLVHLDCYVAVSGLAALLVAGTCFACAPKDRDGERGHGPLAAGLWLGLSALARPVTVFALPFVAWIFVRREPRKVRAALFVLLPFAACAGLSLARNLAVSGEPVVFTAANGLNFHLGNNEAARRLRTMTTNEFMFDPVSMHQDAQFKVGFDLGRKPTRSEISAVYSKKALDEFLAHPGASLAWYAQKTRWFFSPEEPGSSADYDYDLLFTPMLRLAFAPTWLLAALAVAGALVRRDRRDLLLGPGTLVLSHVVACTLTFPLSHYRGPSVPAMAVLAGCAVAAAVEGLRAGSGRRLTVVVVAAATVAAFGSLDPQPQYPRHVLLTNGALVKRNNGDYDGAERDCLAALAMVPDFLGAKRLLIDVGRARHRPDLARPWAQQLLDEQPWNPEFMLALARCDLELGRRIEAVESTDRAVRTFDWSGDVHCDAGQFFLQAGEVPRATIEMKRAIELGTSQPPPDWAIQQCGLAPK